MKESTTKIIENLCEKYNELNICKESVMEAVYELSCMYNNGGTLLICGNGGSAADSMHIVGELMKGFILDRELSADEKGCFQNAEDKDYIVHNLQKALPAISLVSETALFTAYANDMQPDMIFAQQVYGYGKPEDILFAISTSGSSRNVVLAAQTAKAKGMKVISLTGNGGGSLLGVSDIIIMVPQVEAYKVQELHIPVYHAICRALENEFFGE
ncbi:MAG: SIS domain-containing protein [Eubacterium sp.]